MKKESPHRLLLLTIVIIEVQESSGLAAAACRTTSHNSGAKNEKCGALTALATNYGRSHTSEMYNSASHQTVVCSLSISHIWAVSRLPVVG